MTRIALLATCLILLAAPAAAQRNGPSLFFTADELDRIDDAVRTTPTDDAARRKHLLHLSSLLYFGPQNWTFWLQGEKWTPQTQHPHLQVIGVAPDSVRLSVTLPGSREIRKVTLRAHQSLNLLTGEIEEGL